MVNRALAVVAGLVAGFAAASAFAVPHTAMLSDTERVTPLTAIAAAAPPSTGVCARNPRPKKCAAVSKA